MRNTLTLSVCASAALFAAGHAFAAAAYHGGSSDSSKNSMYTRGASDMRDCRFVFGDRLRGTSVLGNDGRIMGSISDLIVERGGTEVLYAIIDTSNPLGLGGGVVAVPYDQLGWNSQGMPTLDRSRGQTSGMRAFSRDEWVNRRGGVNDAVSGDTHRRDAGSNAQDVYAEDVRRSEPVTIKGRITNVDRNDAVNGRTQTVVTVRTDNGEKRVVLGPSSYVSEREQQFSRDQQVTIRAFPTRSGDRYIASSAETSDGSVEFRDSKGEPRWASDPPPEPDKHADRNESYSSGNPDRNSDKNSRTNRENYFASNPSSSDADAIYERRLLLSEIDGRDVSCRGVSCGVVDDVVIERSSGRIMMLVIDPDENFLGIGDTHRLVPVEILADSTLDQVRLDTSKQTVLRGPEAPSNMNNLDETLFRWTYAAYEINDESLHQESRRDTGHTGR